MYVVQVTLLLEDYIQTGLKAGHYLSLEPNYDVVSLPRRQSVLTYWHHNPFLVFLYFHFRHFEMNREALTVLLGLGLTILRVGEFSFTVRTTR